LALTPAQFPQQAVLEAVPIFDMTDDIQVDLSPTAPKAKEFQKVRFELSNDLMQATDFSLCGILVSHVKS
jgi:hypothetical protein